MRVIIASIVVAIAGMIALPQMAGAASIYDGCSGSAAGSTKLCSDKNKGNNSEVSRLITNVVNILMTVVGAVSIIMIIIGGILYAVSAGDPAKAKTAKNTIMYAVVGLVVAIFAYAIVSFVVRQVK